MISRTGQEAIAFFEDAHSWTDGKPRDVRLHRVRGAGLLVAPE